jgi:hypothetical protein
LWLLLLLRLMRGLRALAPFLPASTASPPFPSVLRQTNLPFLPPRRRRFSFPANGGAISTVKLIHFRYVPFLAGIRLGGEPAIQYLPRDDLGCPAKAQAEDVCLVPGPRPPRRLRVSAKRSANAGHLVRRDRHSCARPAEEHALVRAVVGDAAGYRLSDIGPGDRISVERAEDLDVMAATPQIFFNELG